MKPVALAILTLLSAHPVHAQQSAPVLVELFTSQGCNSCPPADELLAELAAREDVLPLAFHVTYWDRLGWPDTLGDERWTERQRAYARLLGSNRIYTPQAIIAGQADRVGSSRDEILRAVQIVREHGAAQALAINVTGKVELPGAASGPEAMVWAVAYDALQRVDILRGENSGRRIDYHNVVRWLQAYAPGRTVTLPLAELRAAGRSAVAVIVQRSNDGAILAVGQRRL